MLSGGRPTRRGDARVDELVIILVRGIGLGAVYALVAISFNVVHNSSGILNFAQGNMLVLGGLFGFFTLSRSPTLRSWLLLVPAAALLYAAVLAAAGLRHAAAAALVGRAAVVADHHPRRVGDHRCRDPDRAGAARAQRASRRFPASRLLGTRTPTPYALAVLLALAWCLALHWFHTRTTTGLAMSAIAQDLEAARAAGIRVRRLQVYAFAISGAVVGSAGFVAAPVMSISADSGIIYVVNGFIAAVIGGLGSNTGALVGGPLVGVASMYAAFQYGGQFQNAVSLALLIGVLMLRPQGLFGRTAARRV